MNTVTVELFGIPRQRAGRAEATVAGATVVDVLNALERSFPGLGRLRRPDGRLSPQYLLSIDGTGFVADVNQPLAPGCRLLLLSADAGG